MPDGENLVHLRGIFFFQGFLGIILTQGTETDKSLLCTAFDRDILSSFDLISFFRQKPQEFFPVLWLSSDQIVQDGSDLIADRMTFGILRSLGPVSIRFSLDDGITVFKADNIVESLQCDSGEEKVLELPAAVQRGGIENDVVMDVSSVCMSGYRKGMIPFGEAHGQLIAEPVCFLRCDLSRLEGLPDLISNDISFVFLPGDLLVLPLGKQEFHRRSLRITGIG